MGLIKGMTDENKMFGLKNKFHGISKTCATNKFFGTSKVL